MRRAAPEFGLLLCLLLLLAACQKQQTPIPEGDAVTDQLLINVTEDGVYQVSLASLQNAGLLIDSLEPDNIYLSQNGTAVSTFIEDGTLIFYGQAPHGRYSNTRPYLLQTGQPGSTIPVSDHSQTGPDEDNVAQIIHLQENLIYEPQSLTDEQTDPWYWTEIGRAQTWETLLQLPEPYDGSGQITLHFWGKTHSPEVEGDHDLDLLINGELIETIVWDGNVHHTATVDIPAGSLHDGENLLTLSNEAPGAAFLDIINLDWLELSLPTNPTAVADSLTFIAPNNAVVELNDFSGEPFILNVQNPHEPTRLVPDSSKLALAEGMVVTAVGPEGFKTPVSMNPLRKNNWRDEENQADLLIVTTDNLIPALEPLVTAREAQGLTVAVVPITEIYETFAFGEQTPAAITNFVAHVFENWQQPTPQYLFLVGEATSDYRGFAHELPENHVPSPMVPVVFSGETVSDSRLADADGDFVPDMAVGRWPVDTPEEVAALVERTLAYEAGTAVNNTLFTTDASEAGFAPFAERLWSGADIPETAVTHLNGAQADEVTQAWNEGAWLTTYIGHGSLELWGKDNLFHSEAVSELDGSTNPPIVVQLTCLTGLFAQPGIEALSEVMLQHEHGPVLLVAATSLTLSNQQEPFAAQLLQNLSDPNFERMGDAFQQAKLALDVGNVGIREISDTFILLGDPSAVIIRPDDR